MNFRKRYSTEEIAGYKGAISASGNGGSPDFALDLVRVFMVEVELGLPSRSD